MPAPAAVAALLVLVSTSSPTVRYRFADPRIDEASGIAVGVRSPGVDYVQNDSGDSARFFAVNATTGRTAAVVTVPGATNVDWEDLAVAPDAAGRSSVWLADIGDNDGVRSEVRVYRVDEPRIAAGARERSMHTHRPDVWRLRYPGRAVDAESLAVTPTGTAYLITKSLTGAVVYRLPPRPDAGRVQTLVRVGTIATYATGAALSRDGSTLAVRTYTDAYVWSVRGNDVAAALRQAPTRVALPAQPQGEGIAIDDDRLLVDSEGVHTAVYSVPLPTVPRNRASSSMPRPTESAPALATAPDTGSGRGWLLAGALCGALAVAVAAAWRWRRAR